MKTTGIQESATVHRHFGFLDNLKNKITQAIPSRRDQPPYPYSFPLSGRARPDPNGITSGIASAWINSLWIL